LKAHIVRKHSSQKSECGQNVKTPENLGHINKENGAFVKNKGHDVKNSEQNVKNNKENIENDKFKCDKCDKQLSCKKTFNNHIKTCKGVKSALECHNCHEIFASRQSKAYHLKKCTSQALILSPPQETATTEPVSTPKISHINNSTVNTGTMNSHNNTVNNIIIACNPGSGDMIEFITNHITNPELKELIAPIINSQRCTPEMVETYTRHLLTNPENRCIEKTNLRSIHSKVHVGNNKWQTKHDKEVLPYYATSVANNMDITLKERLEDDKTLVDRRTLKAIEKYLDYMSEKGYCNDAELGKQMQQEFYEIKHRLKAVIYDTTVDTTVEPSPQTEAAEVELPKSDATD
jgi:hypothetical protein